MDPSPVHEYLDPCDQIAAASSNALFQWRATEQRQYKQICQDIDDAASKNDQAEALRRWKIRQHENGEAGGDDYIRINNPAPLFFARRHPRSPTFFSVALRAADAEDEMNH